MSLESRQLFAVVGIAGVRGLTVLPEALQQGLGDMSLQGQKAVMLLAAEALSVDPFGLLAQYCHPVAGRHGLSGEWRSFAHRHCLRECGHLPLNRALFVRPPLFFGALQTGRLQYGLRRLALGLHWKQGELAQIRSQPLKRGEVWGNPGRQRLGSRGRRPTLRRGALQPSANCCGVFHDLTSASRESTRRRVRAGSDLHDQNSATSPRPQDTTDDALTAFSEWENRCVRPLTVKPPHGFTAQ